MSAATVLQAIKTDLERVIAGLTDVDFYPQEYIDKYAQICTLLDTNPHVIGTDVQAYSATATELVSAPAAANSTGKAGQIAINATHIFLCTATNTWVRASLVFDTWA